MGGNVIAGGSGEQQSANIIADLKKWECDGQVRAQCCDTTSSNTGHLAGACVKLEQQLGRKLLLFACRHHALEMIPKHLFNNLVEKSSSPDLGTICARFEKDWSKIDPSNFSIGTEDDEVRHILTPDAITEILKFAYDRLQV